MQIRSLAGGLTSIDELRQAVLSAKPEANLVLLRDEEGKLRFPPVCPNCGQTAASRLRIERPFVIYVYNDADTPNYTEPTIQVLEVPFCKACIQRHSAEQTPPGPWTPLRRIMSSGEGFAGIVVIAISGLFFKTAIQNLDLVAFGLGCFPIIIGLFLIRPVWNKTKYMTVPAPTSIDTAVDVTPYLNQHLEPPWQAFQFRSPEYAEKFRAANATHIWDPQSPAAKSAATLWKKAEAKRTRFALLFFGAILLWILWDEVLKGFVLPWFRS